MGLIEHVVTVTFVLIWVVWSVVYMLRSNSENAQWAKKKRPERVVAIAKQPRLELSRRGHFVTATTHSGMWRIAMKRNSRRDC
jgi:hypothetical protein